MNVTRVLVPRLAYRLRYGHWCDHQTYSAPDAWPGLGTHTVNRGWSDWEMIDLGRDKIRSCRRCGHAETTRPTPIRDWLIRYPRTAWTGGGIMAAGIGLIVLGLGAVTVGGCLTVLGVLTAAFAAGLK